MQLLGIWGPGIGMGPKGLRRASMGCGMTRRSVAG